MPIRPYRTEEQEAPKAAEPELQFRSPRQRDLPYGDIQPKADGTGRGMPSGCIASDAFWNLFEQKMRAAYAEL